MRRVAFDTNILAYAAGLRRHEVDEGKVRRASILVDDAFSNERVVLPVQVGLELHNVLVRKGGYTHPAAEQHVDDYADAALMIATDAELMRAGFALAQEHRLQTYDAIILAAAASAGCEVLYSEDMQHGFKWGRVEVVNPFA